MMNATPVYELYAIKYGEHMRRASENFIGGDPHDGPMPLDFFIWLARSPERSFVIDTGMDPEVAKKRDRRQLRSTADGLRLMGVDAAEVRDVIITHLHYDHVGGFAAFPKAVFHLQDRELAYATGRHMRHQAFSGAYEVDEVVGVVRQVYKGRVEFHNGDAELAPGLTVHFIGGHTAGLQVVRVMTRRGWVVVASDATHFYANMEQARPFPIVYSVADMIDGHRRLRELAASPAHIIPGHDPEVLRRYPPPARELEGIVARLDVEPKV